MRQRGLHPKNTYKAKKIPTPHIKTCPNCRQDMQTIYERFKKEIIIKYKCNYCGYEPSY